MFLYMLCSLNQTATAQYTQLCVCVLLNQSKSTKPRFGHQFIYIQRNAHPHAAIYTKQMSFPFDSIAFCDGPPKKGF